MEENQILNTPLQKKGGMSEENKIFLDLLMRLIAEGKIQLYSPSSLLNQDVYQKLDEQKQGNADFEAVNLLSAVREIKDLHDAGFTETFQMENSVDRLRETKERIEGVGGDLFII